MNIVCKSCGKDSIVLTDSFPINYGLAYKHATSEADVDVTFKTRCNNCNAKSTVAIPFTNKILTTA